MLFKKRENKLYLDILDNEIKTGSMYNLKSARLVYVKGKGALSVSQDTIADSYWGSRTISEIKLNDVPLIQINSPGCPTCESIVSTGYGIEKAECRELGSISDKINSDFVSLDKSIEDLKSLLLLLESGLYIIADALCYPTDGDGNFFWDVPNEPVECKATACGYLSETFQTVPGNPVFLYPTQSTDCYNENRVEYYENMFNEIYNDNQPRAVVYNFGEFINFIIDGHHKACAAALAGQPLKCIMIIPCTCQGYTYNKKDNGKELSCLQFGQIYMPAQQIPEKYRPKYHYKKLDIHNKSKMTAGDICHREWEPEYVNAVKKYPSFEEFVDMISSDLSADDITQELINQNISLCEFDDEAQQNLKSILCILKFNNDKRLKRTAMDCAAMEQYCSVKKLAISILLDMKDDDEAEQFFIDYIVNCDDKNDPLLSAANSFWD
ncbi:MAG: hypothetical protein K2L19_01670 [Eubacterium sp.]|nr:hypothetical protein [Eubacterium sp.]